MSISFKIKGIEKYKTILSMSEIEYQTFLYRVGNYLQKNDIKNFHAIHSALHMLYYERGNDERPN